MQVFKTDVVFHESFSKLNNITFKCLLYKQPLPAVQLYGDFYGSYCTRFSFVSPFNTTIKRRLLLHIMSIHYTVLICANIIHPIIYTMSKQKAIPFDTNVFVLLVITIVLYFILYYTIYLWPKFSLKFKSLVRSGKM